MSDDEDLFDIFNDVEPPRENVAPVISPPHAAAASCPPPVHERPATGQPVVADESKPAMPSATQAPPRPTVTHLDLMELTAASNARSGEASMSTNSASQSSQGGMAVLSLPTASQQASSAALPDPIKTYLQKESGIRVKHATASLIQLPLFTAGAPITSFAAVHRWLSSASSSREEAFLPNTCIGTVVRKSDPKMGSRNAYAVITLWDMQGGSSTPPHEIAVLVCGGAFDHVFSKAAVGSVVAVHSLARMSGGGGNSGHGNGNGGSAGAGASAGSRSALLRLSNVDTFRLLGHAADLGTCESTSYRSGERCTALVNTRQTKHCIYHISDIRKAASATSSTSSTSAKPVPIVKGGALTTHMNFSAGAHMLSSQSGPASVRVTPLKPALVQSQQLLKKQQTQFFTVRGKSGLPTYVANSDPLTMDGAGIYTGVRSGTALPVTGLMNPKLAQSYPSAQSLGVSTRGRDALAAARLQEDQERTRQLLRRATASAVTSTGSAKPLLGAKRPRDASVTSSPSSVSSPQTAEERQRAVEALRQQFAPLPSGGASAQVRAASGCGSRAQRGDGKRNLLVGAVSQAIAKGTLPVDTTPASSGTHVPGQALGPLRSGSARASRQATAVILSAADNVKSSLDGLRVQAERDKLDAYLDKEIVREKAREVLESITEQSVRGTYCLECKHWYSKLPRTCVDAHHRTQNKQTKKRFIQCTLCQHKTFILGENTIAGKVMPLCPQCKQHTTWRSTNAAPAIAEAPEEIHPF